MDKVTFVYKGGAKVHVAVDDLRVTRRGSEIVELRWAKIVPRPLHVGLDDLAAVWMGHV